MRQKNETAINFNKFKEITQAKDSALKPTKRAFSERQRTRIGDNSQASAKESQRGR